MFHSPLRVLFFPLALGLSLLTVFPAKGETPPKLKLQVKAGEDAASRAVAVLLQSNLASHAGLSLLEGLQTAELEGEHALSETGVVAEGTTVVDRRLRPDVVLTVRAGADSTPRAWSGRVVVRAGEATREVPGSVTLEAPSGGVALLSGEVLAAVGEVAPASFARALGESCRAESPRPEAVAREACLAELDARCGALTSRPWDRALCLADAGEALLRRGKALRKDAGEHAELSEAQREAVQRAFRAKRGEVDEATRALAGEAMQRVMAYEQAWKDAAVSFTKRAAVRLGELVADQTPLPRVGATGDEHFQVRGIASVGVEWPERALHPKLRLAIDFSAVVKTLPNGQERVLKSFQMTGSGAGLERPLVYRLLALRKHKAGGRIVTGVPLRTFAATERLDFGQSMIGNL